MSSERNDYKRKRQIYLKSLSTRSKKMLPSKAMKEIWIRMAAAHLADRQRRQELHMEVQVISLAGWSR